jgi:hypothetical protein
MSLIHCKECQAEVSSKAAACPKCGAPIKVKRGSIGCGGCLVILLIIGGLSAALSSVRHSTLEPAIVPYQPPALPSTPPLATPAIPQKPTIPAAAGALLKIEFTRVPPNGIYVKSTGLTLSAISGDPRSAEVHDAITTFARVIAPGCDIYEAYRKPESAQGFPVALDIEMRAFTDTTPNSVNCLLGLRNPAPKSAQIDALVSAALDLAKCIHPGKHVRTQVCLGDDVIDEEYYSGDLAYNALTNVVGPEADRNGGYRKISQKDRYLLVTQKHPILVRDKLGTFFYFISLVYPHELAPDIVEHDLLTELVPFARTVDGDVTAYAFIGTPDKDPPWHQLVDPKDTFKRFIAVNYAAKSGLITSRTLKIKLSDYKDPGQ